MAQSVCSRCIRNLSAQEKRAGNFLCGTCEADWERHYSALRLAFARRPATKASRRALPAKARA